MLATKEDMMKSTNLIPENVKQNALKFLFPNVSLTPEQTYKLNNYIEDRFEKNGCCVLYAINKPFLALCNRLGLNPGMREVTFTTSALRGTENYYIPPRELLSFKSSYKPVSMAGLVF